MIPDQGISGCAFVVSVLIPDAASPTISIVFRMASWAMRLC